MRAQVAVELFLTMSIGLLVLFWFVNYSTTFSDSTRITVSNQEQKLILKNLAKSINEVCLRQVNISVKVPCLMVQDQNVPYEIDVAGNQVKVSNSFSAMNMSQDTTCQLVDEIPLTVQCADLSYLCFYKLQDYKVHLRKGVCT